MIEKREAKDLSMLNGLEVGKQMKMGNSGNRITNKVHMEEHLFLCSQNVTAP